MPPFCLEKTKTSLSRFVLFPPRIGPQNTTEGHKLVSHVLLVIEKEKKQKKAVERRRRRMQKNGFDVDVDDDGHGTRKKKSERAGKKPRHLFSDGFIISLYLSRGQTPSLLLHARTQYTICTKKLQRENTHCLVESGEGRLSEAKGKNEKGLKERRR